LVQAYQHLWPVNNNDIYQQFTYVTRTIISSSHPVSMLPELSLPHGSFSQSLTEGFIVSRASHKAVTSYACRDRKLPTKRQADSEVSSKRGDFQVALGALFCYKSKSVPFFLNIRWGPPGQPIRLFQRYRLLHKLPELRVTAPRLCRRIGYQQAKQWLS
jgi:hypothetical protein